MRRSITKIGAFVKKQMKLIVGLAVGIFVGTSAIAFAAIPNANGLITGCYQTGGLFPNGQLRLINTPAQSCNGNETAINWNKATTGQFVDNLAGADFTGTPLQYRDFSNTNLSSVNLTSANTSHSIFKNANLTNATFDGTNLSNTDFSNANLSGSQFIGNAGINAKNANLSNTNLSNSIVQDAIDFSGANLNGTNFSSANIGAYIVGGDFRQAIFTNSHLPTSFYNSNFKDYDFTDVYLGASFHENADVSGADFSGTHNFKTDPNKTLYVHGYDGVNFSNANFSYNGGILTSYLQSVNLAGANFQNLLIKDSIFTNSDLSTANLTNVTWSNTICPDNTNSDGNGNTCIGHLVP